MKIAYLLLPILVGSLALSACSRQTAEEKGKAIAEEKLGIAKGVGESLKEKGRNTAESVAQGMGDTMRGVGDGFENAFGIKYKSNPSVAQGGINITRMQTGHAAPDQEGNVISVYMVAKTPVKGALTLIAFDRRKQEMGRSDKEITLTANAAKYEDFLFDKRMNTTFVEYYIAEFQAAKVN